MPHDGFFRDLVLFDVMRDEGVERWDNPVAHGALNAFLERSLVTNLAQKLSHLVKLKPLLERNEKAFEKNSFSI